MNFFIYAARSEQYRKAYVYFLKKVRIICSTELAKIWGKVEFRKAAIFASKAKINVFKKKFRTAYGVTFILALWGNQHYLLHYFSFFNLGTMRFVDCSIINFIGNFNTVFSQPRWKIIFCVVVIQILWLQQLLWYMWIKPWCHVFSKIIRISYNINTIFFFFFF